ncbi:broad substrate specificity ATP-binding cassette transporter ABCG2-like isoform X1 [Scyliorhinus canicula]|uniref:broad substrate specificity ATP-binding cassette transporter ABCG2-like isoform X1 n=1 Tax=Scyliorhinus canicula TaxID=7830 RepID=UPI0018F7B164|nr:broad substrate specificity ATP-binding cassette transporter ABCG2-like isoform X1 [Scyliorhinus canicula]
MWSPEPSSTPGAPPAREPGDRLQLSPGFEIGACFVLPLIRLSFTLSRAGAAPFLSDSPSGMNGVLNPGLNAILGPTGSGKSSFLDILAARKDHRGLSGEVLIDGIPQPSNFKCISGYVVQDDIIMGTLTVRENLLFSAALRLPSSIRFREKEERVDQIISQLGLTKVSDSKVGTELIRGVSGGERKRTNIGMELITDPPVLFLDEPTTGLDSSTAKSVLMILKRLSRSGRTIIFSIHQPQYFIFKLFDSLTLLVNGRIVYHGPAKTALHYFSSIGYECEIFNNPADFFLDVITGDSTPVVSNNKGNKQHEVDLNNEISESLTTEDMEVKQDKTLAQKLAESYVKSSQYKETVEMLKKIKRNGGVREMKEIKMQSVTYTTGFFHQLFWVSNRIFKNFIRNPQSSIAEVFLNSFLGLFLGAIYFGVKLNSSGIQNRVGSYHFISSYVCFSSVSAVALFIQDRKIFIHEYISGYYRISAYFLATIIGDLLPIRTLPAIVFSCITYWMVGYQRILANFFFFMLILLLTSYSATSLAMAVGAGLDTMTTASVIINGIFVFAMTFSGLLVNLPSISNGLSWLQYLSIPRYSFAALQVNEFRNLYFCDDKQRNDTTLSQIVANCSGGMLPSKGICYGEEYLCGQGSGFGLWAIWENIIVLACMTITFLTIAYGSLRFMRKFT